MSKQLRIGATRTGVVLRQAILPEVLAVLLLIASADAAYSAQGERASRARSPAAGVPTYNVEAECRDAASVARLLETTAPDNTRSCIESERRTHEQLLEVWPQFDAADRVMCSGVARSGGAEPTYTELISCLEVARDNRQKNPQAKATGGLDRPDAGTATARAKGAVPGRQASRRATEP